ncbi:MAG TPA: DUF4403 family protein [Bacteroidia bacterium]|nr:DUF4403 family protein [Bacteroidia bacterium]
MEKSKKQTLSAISYTLLAVSFLLFGCKSHKNISKVEVKDDTKPSILSLLPAKPIEKIDLPVFIPILELQNQINQILFAPTYGKYYICNGQTDCDKRFKDLYLENPILRVVGNLISIKMHLSGNTHILFLSPGISTDITVTAVPEVQNDTLYFRSVKLEQSSGDLLLNLTSAIFEKDIEQKIQQNAWYSFRPSLEAITNQAKKQLPVKYGGAVLLLNLTKIYLKKVSIQSLPDQGIMADFSADLEIEDSSFAR